MPGLVGDYNLASMQVTIGGFRIEGWGASDAVKVSRMSDIAESEVSGDGVHVVVSGKNDPRHEATFKVQWGTPAFRYLYEKAQDQQKESKNQGAVSPLAFQLYDPNTGMKIVERVLRFMKLPEFGIGGKPAEHEFTALLPNPDVTPGANISLSG